MEEFTTIKIKTAFKNELDKLKIIPEEPYYKLIKRLINIKEEKASDETNTSSSLHFNEEVKDE